MSKQKVMKSGASLYVRIPLDWRRQNNVEKGSPINVREDEEGQLIISAEVN